MGGEGLIGLTRAFQYAGARSILASLGKVEDRSTAELMKRFYGYLKSGKTKDEALRLAQIDLIRSANFALPVHWAAFQLIGDSEVTNTAPSRGSFVSSPRPQSSSADPACTSAESPEEAIWNRIRAIAAESAFPSRSSSSAAC